MRLLLASLLLLGTLGCSKKDELTPAPTNVGSYIIDGRAVSANATALAATRNGRQYLSVKLSTTPQPAGSEVLTLVFTKQPSEPVTAYQVASIDIAGYATSLIHYDAPVATLTATSGGGVSCALSATAHFSSSKSIVNSRLSQGVFTDVRY